MAIRLAGRFPLLLEMSQPWRSCESQIRSFLVYSVLNIKTCDHRNLAMIDMKFDGNSFEGQIPSSIGQLGELTQL